jgi:hypothetical protein
MATTATHDHQPTIQGYDDLKVRPLFAQLRLQSQVELTQTDAYERANQARQPVLDKLRYLRGDEPIDGYDSLDSDQILAALAGADTKKLGAVRGYEVKLREREEVLSGLVQLRKDTLTAPGSSPAAEDPADAWPGDESEGFMGGVVTAGVFVLMGIAAILLLILLAVLGFVVITALKS